MYRSLGLAVFALIAIAATMWSAADEVPFVELEAPRFDGGTLDNQSLPWLNIRFSAFNSDGTLVAATCGGQVFVWKVPTGELLWRTALPGLVKPSLVQGRIARAFEQGHQVSFSPSGHWLAVSTFTPGSVYFWRVAALTSKPDDDKPIVLSSTAIAEATPQGWNANIGCTKLFWQSEDDAILCVFSKLFTVRIADTPQLRPYVSLHPNHWMDMAVDPHGADRLSMIGISLTPHQAVGRLATVFHNRTAIPLIEELEPARSTPLIIVTASPDWQHFAGITQGLNTLGIFDTHSGRTRILEEGAAQWSTHMAWSNDGQILATGRNPDFRETLQLEEKLYASPPASKDDLQAALYKARAAALILWETRSAVKLSNIPAGNLAVGYAHSCDIGAFSPDDRYLLTHVPRHGSPRRPGYFQLWDVSSVRQRLHRAE